MYWRHLHLDAARPYAFNGSVNMGLDIRFGYSRKREAGQAMVEYAMVTVFLFTVFIAIIQLILMMYAYSTLANAAKEGLRFAMVHGTGYQTVNKVGCSGPGDSSVTPKVSCPDSTAASVVAQVVDFAGLSLQGITLSSVTNNACSAPSGTGDSVNVCYDPGKVNTNSKFGAPCSAPGCLVRVTIQHNYVPFFFHWTGITLNAAAEGRIMN